MSWKGSRRCSPASRRGYRRRRRAIVSRWAGGRDSNPDHVVQRSALGLQSALVCAVLFRFSRPNLRSAPVGSGLFLHKASQSVSGHQTAFSRLADEEDTARPPASVRRPSRGGERALATRRFTKPNRIGGRDRRIVVRSRGGAAAPPRTATGAHRLLRPARPRKTRGERMRCSISVLSSAPTCWRAIASSERP